MRRPPQAAGAVRRPAPDFSPAPAGLPCRGTHDGPEEAASARRAVHPEPAAGLRHDVSGACGRQGAARGGARRRLRPGAPHLHGDGALPARHLPVLRRALPGGLRARAGGRRDPHPRSRARGDGVRRGAGQVGGGAPREARPRGRRRRRSQRPHGRLRACPQGLLRRDLRGAGRGRRSRPRGRRRGASQRRPRGRRRARQRGRRAARGLHGRGAHAAAGGQRAGRAGARRRRRVPGHGRLRGRRRRRSRLRPRRPGQDRRRPGHAGDQQAGDLLRRRHPATFRAVVAHLLDRRRAPCRPLDRPPAPARVARGVARRPRRLRDGAGRQSAWRRVRTAPRGGRSGSRLLG